MYFRALEALVVGRPIPPLETPRIRKAAPVPLYFAKPQTFTPQIVSIQICSLTLDTPSRVKRRRAFRPKSTGTHETHLSWSVPRTQGRDACMQSILADLPASATARFSMETSTVEVANHDRKPEDGHNLALRPCPRPGRFPAFHQTA